MLILSGDGTQVKDGAGEFTEARGAAAARQGAGAGAQIPEVAALTAAHQARAQSIFRGTREPHAGTRVVEGVVIALTMRAFRRGGNS